MTFFTRWIPWIYSFFERPVQIHYEDLELAVGEMHGSPPRIAKQESANSNHDIKEYYSSLEKEDLKFNDILCKIKKYGILGETDYEYIKSLQKVEKEKIDIK